MRHFAVVLLAALLAAGAATLYATADSLPPVVATHFDLAGRVNGSMPRGTYLVFTSLLMFGSYLACLMAAFMIALHLLVVEANARQPPRIHRELLWLLIAGLITATPVWQRLRWRRFRRPG